MHLQLVWRFGARESLLHLSGNEKRDYTVKKRERVLGRGGGGMERDVIGEEIR